VHREFRNGERVDRVIDQKHSTAANSTTLNNVPSSSESNSEHAQILKSIDLIVQSLPPVHDAIGEYTACLASELARHSNVRILTAVDSIPDSIRNVGLERCFSLVSSKRFGGLQDQLRATTANAVVLQYNPFAWGRRGWAPDLVRVMKHFKQERPDVCLGVMFHETYMMNPGFRSWVMRQYQRCQFNSLTSLSDVCFFSTELWANQLHQRKPQAHSVHLPVGSNLPLSTADPAITRKNWSIGQNDFVCGVFGGNHPSRMVPWIESAVGKMIRENKTDRKVVFLHVGGDNIKWKIPGVPSVVTGRLSAYSAADAVATMDLMINPFSDGISTRRGSAMAALQHGVPVLTTRGHATEALWDDVEGKCIFRSPNDRHDLWLQACREAWHATAAIESSHTESIKQFYQNHFDWPVIAKKLMNSLGLVQAAGQAV
jgi:hypothetical protein